MKFEDSRDAGLCPGRRLTWCARDEGGQRESAKSVGEMSSPHPCVVALDGLLVWGLAVAHSLSGDQEASRPWR